jgi:hypothetical protein
MTTGTGQLDRTTVKGKLKCNGQDKTARTGQPGKERLAKSGQQGQDCHGWTTGNRTAETEQLVQDSRDKAAGRGQLGQDSWHRKTGTGQL